jgi:hypothetical protein
MMRLGAIALAVAACGGKSMPIANEQPAPPRDAATEASTMSLHATVRIDPTVGDEHFQGVWLEAADVRYAVDDRADGVWKWFDGAEVDVTGQAHTPAPHFRIATLTVAPPKPGQYPYLGFGPEQQVTAEVELRAAPPGSKLAGTSKLVVMIAGEEYDARGEQLPAPGRYVVRGRELFPDLSHHARSGDRDFWVLDATPAR